MFLSENSIGGKNSGGGNRYQDSITRKEQDPWHDLMMSSVFLYLSKESESANVDLMTIRVLQCCFGRFILLPVVGNHMFPVKCTCCQKTESANNEPLTQTRIAQQRTNTEGIYEAYSKRETLSLVLDYCIV